MACLKDSITVAIPRSTSQPVQFGLVMLHVVLNLSIINYGGIVHHATGSANRWRWMPLSKMRFAILQILFRRIIVATSSSSLLASSIRSLRALRESAIGRYDLPSLPRLTCRCPPTHMLTSETKR
jgi:hypothetical protein